VGTGSHGSVPGLNRTWNRLGNLDPLLTLSISKPAETPKPTKSMSDKDDKTHSSALGLARALCDSDVRQKMHTLQVT